MKITTRLATARPVLDARLRAAIDRAAAASTTTSNPDDPGDASPPPLIATVRARR